MKNYILTLLVALFFFPFNANSQTDEAPTMLVIFENEIPPSMVSDYEEVAKREKAIFKKIHYPRSYFVYQTQNYHYWWVIQLKDLSDFEEFNQELGSFIVRMEEEEGFVFGEEFKGKTNFMKPVIFQWLPNLSCMPERTMKFDQAQYFRWGLCYGKVGFENQLIKNWDKMAGIFKEKQIEIGWQFYTGVVGTENPFYMWGEVYESPLDMETKRAKAFQNLGEEFNNTWNETLQYLRKLEVQEGWYRPDLSYIIEN
jgi:hypothetical protein